MKTFKFTYSKSSKVSKSERILDIFKSNSDMVIDLRQCKDIFESYYSDNVSLSRVSTVISRLWKRGQLLRTPTQLDSGYYYTFANKKLLEQIYDTYFILFSL